MNEWATRDMAPEELAAMDASFEERDIAVITEEINFYKRQAGSAILEIGKRLAEAKEQLSHGEWLPWLEKEVEFSERSAQQYMRLWREYGKSATVADLGCSKALILLGLPASEREGFANETHSVNGEEKTVPEMTRRELEEAIAQRNAAREEAEKYAVEADDAKDEAEQLRFKLEDAQRELEDARDELRDAQRELETLQSMPVEVAVEKVDATEEQLAAARKATEEETRLTVEEETRQRVDALEEKLKALTQREKEAQAAAESAKEAAMSYKAEAEAARKAATAAADESVARFKVLFDQTVENVNRMAALLRDMEDSKQEKLRRALLALADEVRKAAS